MRQILQFLTFSFLLFIVPCSSFAGNDKLLHEKTFPTPKDQLLKVEVPGADVLVSGWDKEEVNIKTYGDRKAEEKFDFSYEKTSYGVLIKIKKRGGFLSSMFNWHSYSLKLEIKVPKKYNTDLNTSGGDINLTEISGDLKANTSGGEIKVIASSGKLGSSTSGGDIYVDNFYGPMKVSTSGGDVTVKNITGDVNASTSGGNMKLSVKNGKVSAGTTGGDVKMSYDGENKGINLSSTGGDIELVLPSDFKARVYLSTTGGDVMCDFPTSKTYKIKSSRFDAELNGGGPDVKCTTTGGDVTIKKK